MQTVLVIDDDADLRDNVGLMREIAGFHPALAQDGKAGVKQALATNPDLVVVDLLMPGLSGIDVCKQIRAAGMKTPLIVLSAIDNLTKGAAGQAVQAMNLMFGCEETAGLI